MKNIDSWKPSKFLIRNNQLVPSPNVSIYSYRMAACIGMFYTENITAHCKGKLLDLGCGTVPFYEFYKNKVTENICADWENTEHIVSHLDIFCDVNQKLPFEDDSFDTILLSDVLEHLSEPLNTLSEIKRILKKDGKLLMNYPFLYGLHEVPYDYCRYTKFRIRSWVEQLDMKMIQESEYGGLFEMMEHSMLRILKSKRGGKFIAEMLASFFRKIHKNKISLNTLHPYMYGFVIQK